MRLVGEDKEPLGVFALKAALDKAAELGLDLVCVTAQPSRFKSSEPCSHT